MHDLWAFSLSLLGFALLHAAVPHRLSFELRAKRHPRWGTLLRLGALACAGASLALWVSGEGGWPTGGILFVLSWVLSGSVFVVAAPVAPRLSWGLALLLPVAATLGIVVGGLHGP
ncbi:hypothetical protein [Pendulispora albinea]|uniref:DUF3325 domain-containing protein n=1 Tax=Pendulispora albinea TaxID=2741071 RepID=A0ABZ2M6N0_9BACT